MIGQLSDRQTSSTIGLLTFRRHLRWVSACAALSVVAGLAFVILRPVTYSASTQLLVYVKEVQPGSELVVSLGRADLTQVENEIEIVRSRGTLSRVVDALNLASDPEFVPAETPIGRLAKMLSGSSATEANDSRSRKEVALGSLARRLSIRRIGTSHTILAEVTTVDPVKSVRIVNEIAQTMLQSPVGAEREGEPTALRRERLQGLGPTIYVMTPAVVPERPSGPRKMLVLLAAAIGGLLAGSGLAIACALADKTFRTAAQVERLGLECIGAVPRPASDEGKTSTGARRTVVEACATQTLLRMLVATEAMQTRVVGVTSTCGGEGATDLARCFVEAASRSHRKILLVGPDLMQTGSSQASPMPAGYDLMVVCLPPLEDGAAFRMAARQVDGILLAIGYGTMAPERIERAFSIAGVAGSDFIGAVLIGVDGYGLGRFGDPFWRAQALAAARRLRDAMPTQSTVRSA